MRGLRDFNWPKIVVDDRQIFLGLIYDLFPGIQAETTIDMELQGRIRSVSKNKGFQAEDGFVLKCV